MAEREYFPCKHSYLRKCEKLTDQELGRLFRALMKYSATGERQELAGRESIAFDFIADDIDSAEEAYAKRCEKNSENGKKGGRGKNQTQSKKPFAFSESEKSQIKEKEKKRNIPPSPSDDGESPPPGDPVAAVEGRVGPLTPGGRTELEGFVREMGAECVGRTLDAAQDAGILTWQYVRGTLRRKREQGVRSGADWDAAEQARRTKAAGAAPAGTDFQPTADRIRKNAGWLDGFLAGQEEKA